MRTTKIIDSAADVAEVVVRRIGDAGNGRGRAVARRMIHEGRRTAAYSRGRLQGLRYAAAGRHPDETVADDILADRVRTSLGPVLHRLDLPRLHVTVERHIVTLHGDVGSLSDVRTIGRAVAAVPGVLGVRSALHVGLLRGDTRPSWSRRSAAPSRALERLLEAADRGGVEHARRAAAVAAVLSGIATWLPGEDWRRVRVHLPADVRSFARRGSRPTGNGRDLVTTVAERLEIPGPVAAQTVRAVAEELARLVPERAAAIESVLPEDTRADKAGERAG
ncbi:MAG TPA: DUF2267 domain-containing protein [Mycobacteriales bacterium]